jgi:hypothetical protein
MARKRIDVGTRVPAILVVAASILSVGLFAAPTASGEEPAQCPQGQFPKTDGTGCAAVPDPTQYGCPPKDFQCMFQHTMPPK